MKIIATALLLGSILTAGAATPVPQTLDSNLPVGEAKGIIPGRVTWVHAPGAVTVDAEAEMWTDSRFFDQQRIDSMVRDLVLDLTGASTEREAWLALIAHHNGGTPYAEGQKIAVKINNNNTYSHADSPEVNATPAMVLALLRSLVNGGGFPQECITIAEPSRFITDAVFNLCHAEFPDVSYVDNAGGNGRVKAEFKADAMAYSVDNGPLARGIATCFTEADYIINLALLKGHVGQGVTLCAKNWYGAMSLHADWRKNHHNNFDQNRNGEPKYITFVDYMGHKDLGGKCILYLIDGLLGAKFVSGNPGPKWQMEPFNGDWPSSLLGSQDPVAIDMVGVDFITTEFPDAPDTAYSDMYLNEAAQAGNAPSGTAYDPEGDGTTLTSLGLAEHWNNAAEKRHTKLDLHYLKR
ncbi:MAG: DUF362 domain-containing protein [Bacteroides sp.]|nr:DUF362 domain-containing protein [Bacteroides sp.]